MDDAPPNGLVLDDRSPTIFGWLAMLLASGGILFFWTSGAIILLTREGGLINQLRLEGVWRTLFLAYPAVFIAALVVATVLVVVKRDLESIAALGAPVALAVLYYLALIYLRPV
jgi:hypothetical protein